MISSAELTRHVAEHDRIEDELITFANRLAVDLETPIEASFYFESFEIAEGYVRVHFERFCHGDTDRLMISFPIGILDDPEAYREWVAATVTKRNEMREKREADAAARLEEQERATLARLAEKYK